MRKSLIKTVLCALSLLLFVSCIGAWVKQVNFGFPETITFAKEGGERVYNGNDSFSSIRVYNPEPTDNDNDFSYGYCEETGVHYEVDRWLRVEYGGVLGDSFNLTVLNVFNSYNNLNYMLHRTKQYNPIGRNQTEEESNNIGVEIENMLVANSINFQKKPGDMNSYGGIVLDVLAALAQDTT